MEPVAITAIICATIYFTVRLIVTSEMGADTSNRFPPPPKSKKD